MNNFDFGRWKKITDLNLNKVVDMVLTNHNTENVTPSTPVFSNIGSTSDSLTILDFGSGVGRNTFPLSEYSNKWQIVGYDNETMLKAAEEFAIEKYSKEAKDFHNITLTSNWNELKNRKFDCIVAIIVLQHISESDLDIYIQDIKKMTNKFIVTGRRSLDELNPYGSYKSVWKILEKNGLFPVLCNNGELYKESTDPSDHILCVYNFNN